MLFRSRSAPRRNEGEPPRRGPGAGGHRPGTSLASTRPRRPERGAARGHRRSPSSGPQRRRRTDGGDRPRSGTGGPGKRDAPRHGAGISQTGWTDGRRGSTDGGWPQRPAQRKTRRRHGTGRWRWGGRAPPRGAPGRVRDNPEASRPPGRASGVSPQRPPARGRSRGTRTPTGLPGTRPAALAGLAPTAANAQSLRRPGRTPSRRGPAPSWPWHAPRRAQHGLPYRVSWPLCSEAPAPSVPARPLSCPVPPAAGAGLPGLQRPQPGGCRGGGGQPDTKHSETAAV